jgi:argininosuccinate lyase
LDRAAMLAAAASPLLLATDAADALAATGIPFREAHEIVSRRFASGEPGAESTIDQALARKSAKGGTSPSRVAEAAAEAAHVLAEVAP